MRLIFGESQFGPKIPVHLGVCQMMDDLPHGPTSRSIRSVQLMLGQMRHGSAHSLWNVSQLRNQSDSRFDAGRRPASNGPIGYLRSSMTIVDHIAGLHERATISETSWSVVQIARV